MSFKSDLSCNYSGKTVVVTGAAGAIGSAIVEAFAENGANVALCCRNIAKGEAMASSMKNTKAFYLDITDKECIKKAAADIESTFGGIDVLINNAGVNVGPEERKPIHEFSDEKWDWICSVDLDGTFCCSKTFIPYILKRGGGNIINISSVVGLVPFRKQCAFTAAKAGVVNLSKAMAIELAPDNIRVNVICPGSIVNEGTKALFYNDAAKAEAMMVNIPQHKPGKPDDIANCALYVASDTAASYMTGSVITVDGGWTCGFARDF